MNLSSSWRMEEDGRVAHPQNGDARVDEASRNQRSLLPPKQIASRP
jgi:hypothetical protein